MLGRGSLEFTNNDILFTNNGIPTITILLMCVYVCVRVFIY